MSTSDRRPISALLIGVLAGLLLAIPGYAFKVDVHVWIAQEVLNQVTSKGTITVRLAGRSVEIAVPADRAIAIRKFPEYFRMGSIGPDAYPDVLVGQMIIHPGTPHRWGSAEWLRHLLESATTDQEKAFALGALVHAASDVFAHTYVNRYAGEIFDIDEHEAASLRHVRLESFISDHLPQMRDRYGKEIGLPHQFLRTPQGELAIPADFLRSRLYFDPAALEQIKASGSAAYIPLIASLKGDLAKALEADGVIEDLEDFAMQLVALLYFDIELSKDDAAKLREYSQKIHNLGDFSEETTKLINEVDKGVLEFHVFTRDEAAKFFKATERAVEDLRDHKARIDEKKREVEQLTEQWEQEANETFQTTLRKVCSYCPPFSLGCKKTCKSIETIKKVENKYKERLRKAKDDVKGLLHELEDKTVAKQKSIHDAAIAWMDTMTAAMNLKIAMNQVAYDYFSKDQSISPMRRLVQNWHDDIDRSMNAFVVANGETIINTITPDHRDDLKPYLDWFTCFGKGLIGVPVLITQGACTLEQGVLDIRERFTEVEKHLAEISPSPFAKTLFKLKQKFEKELLNLKHDLINKGTDELAKQFDSASGAQTLYWKKTLSSTTDADALNAEFAVDKSGRGLAVIPDIAARVQNEMPTIIKGDRRVLEPEKFAVLRDSMVLSRLALLDQRGLNELAKISGLSHTIYGEKLYAGDSHYATNVLYGMARNIDGNHHWHELAPPNPRQDGFDAKEFEARSKDIEAGFTYRNPNRCTPVMGMRMWVDPFARTSLFEKLFVAPLPAGVDLPKSLNEKFEAVLHSSYPWLVTREKPWGDDGIRLVPSIDVRSAQLSGTGVLGTTVALRRGDLELARSQVGNDGRWRMQARISLSRSEVLTFMVYRANGQPRGDIVMSYCTEQTDVPADDVVEVRSFALIVKNDTLSRLAYLLSGNSRNFVSLYAKNSHLIPDQDLIFPNQIIEIPALGEWRFPPES